MIITDLVILALIGYSAYIGTHRGLIFISLEFLSFIIASATAILIYHPLGTWLKTVAGTTTALSNVAAFMLIWVTIEVIAALIIRFFVLPRLPSHLHLSRANRIGGSGLNAIKSLVFITIGLMLFAGLPLSAATKHPLTDAYIPKLLLASSGNLQHWISSNLGRDLGESLNFFTVPSEPENNKRVELGFTTTNVRVDEGDEQAMLTLINHERTTRGLQPLTLNPAARDVARAYSRRMLAEGYFSHIDNDHHNPFDRMRDGHVSFGAAGENLALAPTLALAHQGLMNSPGHRANILSTQYRTVGIGIIDAGPYGLMVSQEFTD